MSSSEFFDLSVEDRIAAYDMAYQDGVENFFDLPAEERGRYYVRAINGQ